MAKLFNGKILFASALQPSGAQPLDDRSVVQSFNDLINSDTFVVNGASAAYNGMIVSVLDEQKSYMLVNKEDITNKNSWIAVGSGNGSIAVETYQPVYDRGMETPNEKRMLGIAYDVNVKQLNDNNKTIKLYCDDILISNTNTYIKWDYNSLHSDMCTINLEYRQIKDKDGNIIENSEYIPIEVGLANQSDYYWKVPNINTTQNIDIIYNTDDIKMIKEPIIKIASNNILDSNAFIIVDPGYFITTSDNGISSVPFSIGYMDNDEYKIVDNYGHFNLIWSKIDITNPCEVYTPIQYNNKDLSEYEIDTPKVDTKKEKLLKLVKDACEFYNYNLLNSDNEGIKYLSGRGITIDIIDNFKLGYAPSDSSKTLRYLTKKGYTVEEIVEAGIGINNNGFLDRFSSRVVFPISDINGNVVAFSGRRIDEGKANKYINSNENILFNKSECLYNFYSIGNYKFNISLLYKS